ncbi:DHS-like NAD/FAD-binding domain-containing protein [Echria macrotheca]|uniref:DHS-like NAD/FAD-binding domain-containing protein n=1 Tax=Echria macrotheca TaxID=438768 RepID=A0AAJ0FBM2_9PEZI|nr:DHS-like NAD/FAD-binding domain-containing protein [Echria macrotheca]
MASSQPINQPSSPPSSPLSVFSKSPSLPSSPIAMDAAKRYPSPSSSAVPSGSASPMKPSDLSDTTEEIRVRTDGPPPPKRRRIAAPPGPRTTTYLDLESRTQDEDQKLLKLLSALRKKKKIVVIAGAGISVSAGIPDFRSSTGLFTTLRGQHKLKASGKHLFDASVYKHDSSTTSFHDMVRELAHMTSQAAPTPFHHMLASIAQEGRLLRLYTQNIDSIDTQMPPLATAVPLNSKGPWPTTIQLHGGLEKMVCTKCGHLESFNASLFEGPEPPLCEKCKEQDQVRTAFAGKRSHGIGRLRPRIVLYNEYNPDEEAIGMVTKADLRRVPDAVIVVGTSLKIPGVRRIVKEMCQLTRDRRDGITAWINIDPEPQGVDFKDCWDFVVKGKCDDIAELVNLPRWDQQDIGDRESYMVTGDEEKEKVYATKVNRDKVHVFLERKRKLEEEDPASSKDVLPALADGRSKLLGQAQDGIPTPVASPKMRNPLPTSKLPAKGRGKQSTLSFGGVDKAKKAQPTKSAAPRKPRQSKKDVQRPKNRLDQTFKATKAVVPAGKQTPTKQMPFDDDSSGLSSPPEILSLPSLRPKTDTRISPPMKVETGLPMNGLNPLPSTPTSFPTRETVSPKSKPKCMDHLID